MGEWAGEVSIPIYPGKNGALFRLSYRPAASVGARPRPVISGIHDSPETMVAEGGSQTSGGEIEA